jgi:hypothetical protein
MGGGAGLAAGALFKLATGELSFGIRD